MPKVSRLVAGRQKRIEFLTKYALVHPEHRNREHLCLVGMGTFSRPRPEALQDADVALARIQFKGDQYGISPESRGEPVTDAEIVLHPKVAVIGAGMGEVPIEDLRPLTPEEEKAIRETSILDIIASVPHPKITPTDFHIIEEE